MPATAKELVVVLERADAPVGEKLGIPARAVRQPSAH